MALAFVATELDILGKLTDLIDCDKSVSLMIKNESDKMLCDPMAFTTSGKIHKTIPHRINPGAYGELGFHKTPFGFCGAEGVVVYRIDGTKQHLCIFYCVPYIGLNGFWLQWKFGRRVSADEDLCSEMSDKQWEIEDEIKWHDAYTVNYEATGFMSQSNKAQMIVKVLKSKD